MKINNININILIDYLMNINSITINRMDYLSLMTQNIEKNQVELDWFTIERIFYKNNLKIYKKEMNVIEAIASSSTVVPMVTYVESLGWIAVSGRFGPLIRIIRLERERKHEIFLYSRLINLIQGDLTWIYGEPINSFSGGTTGYEKEPKYIIKALNLMKMESTDIRIIVIYSVAIVILSLVVPVGTQSLINILTFGTLIQPILVLTFLVTVLLGMAGFLRVLQTEVAEVLQQKLFIRLVAETNEKIVKIRNENFEKKKIEEIVNYFLDISTIQKSGTVILIDGLSVILQFIVGIFVLVLYHPFFILVDVFLVIFIFVVVFKYLGHHGVETSIDESKSKYKIVNWFEEIASNSRLFRSGNMTTYATMKTEVLSKLYLENRTEHFKIIIRQVAALALVHAGGMGVVLGIGGYLVITGGLSLGQLIAAEIIVSKILDNFGKFGKYLESYYDLLASLDKVGNLLDLPLETSGEVIYQKTMIGVDISIKNLELEDIYEKKLKIDRLDIRSGTKLGVYSHDPNLPFLFLKLLYGLEMDYSGNMIINGNLSFKELDLSSWRDAVSILSDDNLYSGNIYENIKLGRDSVDSQMVRNVLQRVGCLEGILERFQDGITREVTSSGFPIVKEELFKLNLARCIADIPDLLIVDKIFDRITAQDKSKFLEILQNELESTTVIIFSSNKEDLSFCDMVVEV